MDGSGSGRGRGLLVLLGTWVLALAAMAALSSVTIPKVVVTLVVSGLVAYAVTESPTGPGERPARSWPQDESGAGG